MSNTSNRPIFDIAEEIQMDWKKPYFGAEPYLAAMHNIRNIEDHYGADSADTIITYFLGNSQTWRGPVARKIKAELNKMLMRRS